MTKESGKKKGTTVNLRERVTVYATATHPHAAEGAELKIGALLKQKMIDNGYVTEQPTEPSAKSKKQKAAEA